ICTFYAMARFYNADAELVFFSNSSSLPVVEDSSVNDVLKNLDVKIYTTPFEYITPKGYSDKWRNQFYEFSILKFISRHEDFNNNDNFLLLDSDCIISQNLNPLFQLVEQHKCITYSIDYDVNHRINGNSRNEMKTIFESLCNKKLMTSPQYHAGEFYASTVSVIKTIIEDFYVVWEQLINRHEAGLPKLHEEAHVLSYLFFINNYHGGQANAFIKRLWTDPSSYRNVSREDVHLAIWHLPAEKRFGFKKLFTWLQQLNFDISELQEKSLQRKLRATFLVPTIPIQHRPWYMGKSLLKKMFA
ncbi:MAG: hypothetical protein H7Y03_04190, partial [Chitinophagaceae bacterium]|nr:hypothetical protein [Chitinophagaceae bacterium]